MVNASPHAIRVPSRILVGLGESRADDDVLRAGVELGRACHAQVDVVQAVPTASMSWPELDAARGASVTEQMLEAASRAANARALAAVGDPSRQPLVRTKPGQPAKVLLDEARATNADWIVIGPHRHRGGLDFGSTARAIYARSTLPVWLQPCAWRPIERLLAPVDLSAHSLVALASACVLAQALRASVHAVYVFDVARRIPIVPDVDIGAMLSVDDLRQAERRAFLRTMESFDWRGVAHEASFVEGGVERCILDLARDSGAIVMGTHGRTGLASVLLGGVAYAVLKSSERPVLAVRDQKSTYLT